jgi:hypothetical protein
LMQAGCGNGATSQWKHPQTSFPTAALESSSNDPRHIATTFDAANCGNPPISLLQALGTTRQFIFPYRKQ